MNFDILVPDGIKTLDNLKVKQRPLEPFSRVSVDFIDELSKLILSNPTFKAFPELIALAFWMRSSHISKLKKSFFDTRNIKIARGVAFHIAPSNVDTIFVYSWFISMLVGNSNIIRLSQKSSLQMDTLLNLIIELLSKDSYQELKNRVVIIKYGHIEKITAKFSSMADIRVIWGGDETIKSIRAIPLKPTAVELTFADKFSFALIKSNSVLKSEDSKVQTLVEKFYNDAFWFGQQACSSSRLIVWLGDRDESLKAQERFWTLLESFLLKNPPQDITPSDIINKLVTECSLAIEGSVNIIKGSTPYINRVLIDNLEELYENLHCGAGLFYELFSNDLESIFENSTKKHQTISYFGFKKDEIQEAILKATPYGVDRVVPIGRALDFSYIWDGFNLLNSFSREIEIWR